MLYIFENINEDILYYIISNNLLFVNLTINPFIRLSIEFNFCINSEL